MSVKESKNNLREKLLALDGPPNEGQTEAERKLIDGARRVDITKLGCQAISLNKDETMQKLQQACIRYGVAQALYDGIATTEAGLVARDVMPYWDLLSPQKFIGVLAMREIQTINNIAYTTGGYGSNPEATRWFPPEYLREFAEPQFDQWRQPEVGVYTRAGQDEVFYFNSRDTNYKVLVFYGARNIRPNHIAHISNLSFHRGMIKRIEQIDTNQLAEGDAMLATPVLYKKGDHLRIVGRTTSDAIGQYDMIQPLGVCVEAIGNTITG